MNGLRRWLPDLGAGLVPWLAYAALARSGRPEAGAGLAAVTLLCLRVPAWRDFKILDGALLVFFLLMAWTAAAGATGHVLWLCLATAAFGSAAIGKPFTLQYARQTVGPEWWGNRHFVHVNQVLTGVWGSCFLIAFLLPRPAGSGAQWAPAATVAIQLSLFAAAIWFSRTYPRWYRLHRYLPRVRAGLEPYLRVPRAH